MMPTLQFRRTSLFWFQGAWELGRVFGGELFCFCLFVFQLPRWVIILLFSVTSGWGFLVFYFSPFKMFNFPTIYLGSGRFFLSRRLVKFFAFFYFCLFVFIFISLFFFCFQKFHPPLICWYQMLRPYPYSITQMMVDIMSSTILNSLAIQWKI